MSVCHAASIVVDDESVHFFGPEDAHWHVPLERIRVLGEVRSTALEDGHYLAILIDDSGAWFQAPVRAAGMEQCVQRLAERFRTPLALQLSEASDSSRILWPATLASEALFDCSDDGRLSVRARVLDSIGET